MTEFKESWVVTARRGTGFPWMVLRAGGDWVRFRTYEDKPDKRAKFDSAAAAKQAAVDWAATVSDPTADWDFNFPALVDW